MPETSVDEVHHELMMVTYPYVYKWGNNKKRADLQYRCCRVVVRGIANSRLVEFENGQREVISGNALRRRRYDD